MEKENFAHLENLISLEQNITKNQKEQCKSKCNSPKWVEGLTKTLTAQESKIEELIMLLENKEEIKQNMISIETELLKIDSTTIQEKCERPDYI